jgi:hypothetical protein
MKPPRILIGRAMGWIAVIGLNIGLFRASWRVAPDVAIMLTLISLTLQVGAWRLVRGSARSRPFWIGFLLLGSACPATLLWFVFVIGTSGSDPPRSPIVQYMEFSLNLLVEWERPWMTPHQDNLFYTVPSFAVIGFLPQLLPALLGGVLGRGVVGPWVRGVRAEATADPARSPAPVRDPVREEILGQLASLSELTPDVPFGQLIANLSNPPAEAVWEMKDEQLLDAIRQHAADLAKRLSVAS